MRVSDVFAVGSGPDYDYGDSYDNFGCSAGDCYAGDHGRYSYSFYSGNNGNGPYNGGLRNASASRGNGYNRLQG